MEENDERSTFTAKSTIATNLSLNPNKWTDSTIERHDLNNLECKVGYKIEPDLQENRYEMSVFFFIPNSLNVNQQTYSGKEFFGDITTNLRFKTPQMALTGLLKEDNELSPFYSINHALEKIINGYTDEKLIKKIKYELRILGSIIKVALRDQFEYYYQEGLKETQQKEVFSQLKSYLQDIQRLQQKMVSLRDEIAQVQIPQTIHESFSFVDDYIGRQIEERLTKSISLFQNIETFQKICFQEISDRIKNELERRSKTNSRLSLKKESLNTDFTYWERILKKYIQSVLYLDIRAKDQTSGDGGGGQPLLQSLLSFSRVGAMTRVLA